MPDAISGGGVSSSDGCRKVLLVAAKRYDPTRYFDEHLTLAPPGEFFLPSTISVVDGNSGDRANTVDFTYSNGSSTRHCTYFGMAPISHPLPFERSRGLEYGDPECDFGLLPGHELRASTFTLHVADGDPFDAAHETRVAMELDEATPCAPEDAGHSDAETDAPHDAGNDVVDAGDASGGADAAHDASADAASDAAGGDASSDAGSDAGRFDAGLDASSAACGDGVRAATEECDLGSSVPPRATCSATCEVNDLLAEITPGEDASVSNARALGDGRHPIAAKSDGSFAIAYLQQNLSPIRIALTSVGSNGVPTDTDVVLDADTQAVFGSDPVIAALPNGNYAAAFTDLNGDGDALGVALRSVNIGTASTGSLSHANTTTSFSQYDADVLWDGAELVVVWTDDSSLANGPDIKLRTFDGSLNATSGEQMIAATTASEDEAALCAWDGTYAVAWRADDSGMETIHASAGSNTWTVGPIFPGPANERPAIAELDATHLLLVFAQGVDLSDSGVSDDSKISAAILDTSANGAVTAFDLPNLTSAIGLSQDQPNVISAGGHVYVAWRTAAALGDPNAEELWLKEVTWNGSSLNTSGAEIPLPRSTSHRIGDQRRAALAYSSVPNALVLGWDDLGKTLGTNEPSSDVVVEFAPLPIFRMP